MTDDVPDHIQDIFLATTAKLREAGLDDVQLLHHYIAHGLAMLPLVVCPEHLLGELAFVDAELAKRKALAGRGAH